MKLVLSWRAEKLFRRPGSRRLQKFAARASALAGSGLTEDSILSVTFLSREGMIEANREILGHDRETDVICLDYREAADGLFPLEEDTVSIDLLLCPAVALAQAEKRSIPYAQELTLYLVHGLLHAAGEDDLCPPKKRKMRRAEQRVMKALTAEFNPEDVFLLRDAGEKAAGL